jgi:hypothetical protein
MIEVPMSDAQFEAAAEKLRERGIELAGSSGTLTKDGVTARYVHADGQLTIEVVDRPFFLPLSLVEEQMRAYLEQVVS